MRRSGSKRTAGGEADEDKQIRRRVGQGGRERKPHRK
jgi:hypothetical protein